MDAYTAFEMYLAHVPARARYDREIGSSPRALRAEMKWATGTAERSMAAALAAASLAGGAPPPKIDTERTTKLRNSATHAGHYPKDAEAENLCLEVERVILALEALLSVQKCANLDPYWMKTISEEIDDSIARQGVAELPRVHSSMGTVLAVNSFPIGNAKEAIESYRRDIIDDVVSWRVW
jgi:hypothetical protein